MLLIYTYFINIPIGEVRASAENGALTGLWFVGQKPEVLIKNELCLKLNRQIIKPIFTW